MKAEVDLTPYDVSRLNLVALTVKDQMNWETLIVVMMRWGLRDYQRIEGDFLANADTLKNALLHLENEQ